MALTVLVPALRRSLTTPQRFRDAAPETDLDDAELERENRRASSWIEGYLGRVLARETVAETFTTRSRAAIVLDRYPIVELVELRRSGLLLSPATFEVDLCAGMLHLPSVDGYEGMWRALGGPPMGDDCDPPRTYTATYTSGYELPTDDGDGDLPAEIEHACHLVMRGEIELRARGLGVTGERLGDASRTYYGATVQGTDVGISAGLAAAKPFLAAHRRVPF